MKIVAILAIIALLAISVFTLQGSFNTFSTSQSVGQSTGTPSTGTTATSTVPHATTTPPTPMASGGVHGVVTIGPTCPVQKDPPDGTCDDKPYAASLLIRNKATNAIVTVHSDAQGKFSQTLAPGTYEIKNNATAIMPTLQPVTFTVRANAWTDLKLSFDSGIR